MTVKKGVILLVDDEEMIRQLLYQKLTPEGYRCEQAANAEEALEKLKKDSIELVILDIKMPGESGVELLPEIKAKYPDTAVIMATAVDDASTAINCMKAGAFEYVRKPYSLNELVIHIERAMAHQRSQLDIQMLKQELRRTGYTSSIVGKSRAIVDLRSMIAKVAATQSARAAKQARRAAAARRSSGKRPRPKR